MNVIPAQEPSSADITDMKKVLEDRGIPIVSFAEQQRRDAEIIAEQQALNAPAGAVPAIPGVQPGVVPAQTGFSYIQPRERIELSDTASEFLQGLPNSPHYEDRAVRGFARQLWLTYKDLYEDEYETAIQTIEQDDDTVEATDIELADFVDRAKSILRKWSGSEKWQGALLRSKEVMGNAMKRAARLELTKSKQKGTVTQEDIDAWLADHLAEVAEKVALTTRTEIQKFLAGRMEEGITDRKELAKLAREHFDAFPQWKADRLARTEIRDIYNAATLLAAQSAGVDRVQALDAQVFPKETDSECVDRNGKIFSVANAFKENEHPNGTLAWRLVPVELSIERRDFDGAEFDSEANRLTLSDQLDQKAENKILLEVVDYMVTK